MPRSGRLFPWRQDPMHQRRIEFVSTFVDAAVIGLYPQHKCTQIAFFLKLLPSQRYWKNACQVPLTICGFIAVLAPIPGKYPRRLKS